MKNINTYIKDFFDNLDIYDDSHKGTQNKINITSAIFEFLNDNTEKKAYKVYENFFKAYWIGTQHKKNPFLMLTEEMKTFEEQAGSLLEKQRDHYIHTIFVFILGLTIFSQNDNYRRFFDNYAKNKERYSDFYPTKNEEFFYRWGIASLYHDIAYPLEIILEQVKRYVTFIWNYPEEINNMDKGKLELPNFKEYIKLPELKSDKRYQKKFYKNYPKSKNKFYSDSISLLSENISYAFRLDIKTVKNVLKKFLKKMEKNSFIDHGFYSSIIALRWHYYLLKIEGWHPAYFYFPITDAASAILLHNYYRYGLMKDPFNLKLLNSEHHPIAYLLILCDELQIWGRKCYGEKSKREEEPIENFNIIIDNSKLEINFNVKNGKNNNDLSKKIKNKISDILDIKSVFSGGLKINNI